MSIKAWQTRWEIGLHKDDAMQAEIDELRAALQERDALNGVKELRYQLEIARSYIKALSEEIIKLSKYSYWNDR